MLGKYPHHSWCTHFAVTPALSGASTHWHEQHSPTRSVAYCGQGGLVLTLRRAKEVRKCRKALCCHSVMVTTIAIYRYMYPCVDTGFHGALWQCSNSVNSLYRRGWRGASSKLENICFSYTRNSNFKNTACTVTSSDKRLFTLLQH